MEKEGRFQDEFFKLSALFFADDGLFIARTQEEMERMIDALIDLSHITGLEINTNKSNVLIFNSKAQIEEIKGIKVTNEMKYLGIIVTYKKNCFKTQKETSLQKAKLENLTYPVTSQSCNKILISKTYWKSVVLPLVLYRSSILGYTEQEVNKLQRIENTVYRAILGAPNYAQTPTVRGEIGSSTTNTRIRDNQLKYLKYVHRGE